MSGRKELHRERLRRQNRRNLLGFTLNLSSHVLSAPSRFYIGTHSSLKTSITEVSLSLWIFISEGVHAITNFN